MLRTTYTYALLGVSPQTFDEIHSKLKEAGYEYSFHDSDSRDGLVIDMHGLALVKNEG